jgi:hypothetical protein
MCKTITRCDVAITIDGERAIKDEIAFTLGIKFSIRKLDLNLIGHCRCQQSITIRFLRRIRMEGK